MFFKVISSGPVVGSADLIIIVPVLVAKTVVVRRSLMRTRFGWIPFGVCACSGRVEIVKERRGGWEFGRRLYLLLHEGRWERGWWAGSAV